MSKSTGLLVIDLQYGFSPNPDMVESIRNIASDYSVVVATQFVNPPNSSARRVFNDGLDGGAVIDVGHQLILPKSGYGLNTFALDSLRTFSKVASWDLVGSRTGACLLACGFSLWDANISFRVIRALCAISPGPIGSAVDTFLTSEFGL